MTFWYVDRDDVKRYETMRVDEFISAHIEHVPERQFKMIRYYGAYSRKRNSGILALRIGDDCPNCGTQMEFVMFFKKDPPLPSETGEFGMKLDELPLVLLRRPKFPRRVLFS